MLNVCSNLFASIPPTFFEHILQLFIFMEILHKSGGFLQIKSTGLKSPPVLFLRPSWCVYRLSLPTWANIS